MPGLDPRHLLEIWEDGSVQGPVSRAVILLAAIRGEQVATAAEVDVGTRDVHLAKMLAEIAGTVVPAIADCGRCGALLDVPVDLTAICALPVHEPGEALTAAAGDRRVSFRLPTSRDLLALSGLPAAAARRALLARCLGLTPGSLTGDHAGPLGEAVEEAMEVAAPAGAVDLMVQCPGCGAGMSLPLDLPELLWAEIEAQVSEVLEDVHALAAAYGWTEADVLALTPMRRAAYLAMADA
jgi:hypothetical protein